jgi:hypothetical protein
MSLVLRLFNRDASNEVAFQEMIDGTGKDKPGYDKTGSCGEQAKRDGLQYFWVDTWYINRQNNTMRHNTIQ